MGNKDFICDDRIVEPSDRIKNMTTEEIEKEYQKRFGEFLKQIDQ